MSPQNVRAKQPIMSTFQPLATQLALQGLRHGGVRAKWGLHLRTALQPTTFFGLLAALLISYLVMVEGSKQWFYRRLTKA